jgi:hypothetical protein
MVQIRYMLGDAGESFMVGFGPKSPLRVTHGAASCAGNYTVPPAASRTRCVCCMLSLLDCCSVKVHMAAVSTCA